MRKAVIVTSYVENPVCREYWLDYKGIIICTDGGYDILKAENIIPDMVIGDFDSISSPVKEGVRTLRYEPEKDYTDLELAIKLAIKTGVKELDIIGGIGGRLDHTVANIQLLSQYVDSFNRLEMFDGKNRCFVLSENSKKECVIERMSGCYVSVFALSDKCEGVSCEGLKYPLYDKSLSRKFPLGVSNEFIEKRASISMNRGSLLIVISSKR